MQTTLAAVTDAIVESYNEIGNINHIEGPNLPSRREIERIIADIEALVFPGYHEDDGVSRTNVSYWVMERVGRLLRNLVVVLRRALCYERRVGGERFCREVAALPSVSACTTDAERIAYDFAAQLPALRKLAQKDVEAAYQGDPAAQSRDEVILSYPGVEAILVHRAASLLHRAAVPLIPRMMSEYIHGKTGIDIHPGAQIGESFFIDHATGVVIGESTEIGEGVKVYQGVTLGALSVRKEAAGTKRHPTIEDNVTIYAGATILGGETKIGHDSIIGGNVWLTRSVPPHSRVYVSAGGGGQHTEFGVQQRTVNAAT